MGRIELPPVLEHLYQDIRIPTFVVCETIPSSLSCYSLVGIGADIPWIQGITKLPLVIKGIQCVEVWGQLPCHRTASNSFQDAEKAFEYGVQGIVLSNHGGRQLDLSVHYLAP
jgi:hypothetical protein